MAEHSVPQQLIDFVVADLVSRVAEFGAHRPQEIEDALAVLRSLPAIEEGTELEMDWHSEFPPESAILHLTSDKLCLTIADDEGSREVYDCEVGFLPRIDSDLESWIRYMRALDSPELSISCWRLAEAARDVGSGSSEVKLAEIYHENFHSCVTLSINQGGQLRVHVYDTGPAPMACFGGDYDRWVDIAADAKDALIVELLKERYAGNIDAVSSFRDFCERTGIPHQYGVY